jgi:hypothetical protein
MSQLLIGYPTGWTLGVVPDVERGERIVAELVALGVPAESTAVIAGADAPAQLRRLGASSGPLARLRRSVQFMTMDQLPDLFVYEAAVTEGRTLVGARVPGNRNADAVAIMRRHGAHFINRFGALMTTEIEPWRGTMPRIPQYMQR